MGFVAHFTRKIKLNGATIVKEYGWILYGFKFIFTIMHTLKLKTIM